jgi:membrane protease YdiL (CAAX protease family)
VGQGLAVCASSALALVTASVIVQGAAFAHAGQSPAQAQALFSLPTWLALAGAANELAVGLVLWAWLRHLRSPLRPFSPDRPQAVILLAAGLIIFGLAPLSGVASELTRRALHVEVTTSLLVLRAVKGASVPTFLLLLVALSVLPAFVEEALFRGFLTPIFAQRSSLAGILVPSVLFGVFHVEPTQIAGTTVLGIGFGFVRLASGSLGGCMAAHGAYNAAVLLASIHAPDPPLEELEIVPALAGLLLAFCGVALLAKRRAT